MVKADTTPRTTVPELTGFQRDLLFVIASIGPEKGTKVKEDLETYYATEINHGRLYPNLDTLVDSGLVVKDERDKRTNEYSLTAKGEQLIEQRREWESERARGVSA